MPQVLKPAVRRRIVEAGEAVFFESGYHAASMTQIGQLAGVSASNIYRYFADKDALFEAVLPNALIERHEALLSARLGALEQDDSLGAEADELLDFWVANRFAMAILLGHGGPTTRSWYQDAFVDRLTQSAVPLLHEPRSEAAEKVLRIVFDNTRRALAAMFRDAADAAELRVLIHAFWSYQVPGLAGLIAWTNSASPSSRRSSRL